MCKAYRIITMQGTINISYIVLWKIFTHKKIHLQIKKECVFKYFLNATLNYAFQFLRILRLNGKMLKILTPT
jgi:hypothetical protein